LKTLKGKTILITGGSLGIGFATAKKCVEEGSRVIIVARNKTTLHSSLKILNQISTEQEHLLYSLDVKNINAVNNFSKWIEDQKVKINGLVNCAGVYGPIGKTIEVDMKQFTKAFNINFFGTIYMCNAIIPIMDNSERRKVVNFSGGGAATPFPNYSAYATSKAAIVRFTENLNIELTNKKIDINSVAPGFVATRLHEDTLKAGPEKSGNNFYNNTIEQIKEKSVPPELAADLTAFLLSKDSDGIGGKFISAPWDDWENINFKKKLIKDQDFATLRRVDDKIFYKK